MSIPIEERRSLIASYTAKGKTLGELPAILYSKGVFKEIKNKDGTISHQQITLDTIKSDIKAIDKEWKKAYSEEIHKHKARQLRELFAIKKEAWEAGKLDWVMRALDREMDLLGTKTPPPSTALIKEKEGSNEFNQYNTVISIDSRDKKIVDILDAARERKAKLIDASGAAVGGAA